MVHSSEGELGDPLVFTKIKRAERERFGAKLHDDSRSIVKVVADRL